MLTRASRLAAMAALALSLLAGSLLARGPGRGWTGGGTGGGPGGPGSGPAQLTFPGEYQEMVDVTKFSAAQKESLHKLLLDYDKAVKDNGNAKLAAANADANAKTDEDRKAADEKTKAVAAQRDAIERTMKAKTFEIMTPDQRSTWTGYKLEKIFAADLSALTPGLDDAQKAKLKALCQAAGAKSPSADVAAETKLLDSVRKDIGEGILTDPQRTQYRQMLAEKYDPAGDKFKDKIAGYKPSDGPAKPNDKPAGEKPNDAGSAGKPKPADEDTGTTTKGTGKLEFEIPTP